MIIEEDEKKKNEMLKITNMPLRHTKHDGLTIIVQDKQIKLYTNMRCNHNNDNFKSVFNTQ